MGSKVGKFDPILYLVGCLKCYKPLKAKLRCSAQCDDRILAFFEWPTCNFMLQLPPSHWPFLKDFLMHNVFYFRYIFLSKKKEITFFSSDAV